MRTGHGDRGNKNVKIISLFTCMKQALIYCVIKLVATRL